MKINKQGISEIQENILSITYLRYSKDNISEGVKCFLDQHSPELLHNKGKSCISLHRFLRIFGWLDVNSCSFFRCWQNK